MQDKIILGLLQFRDMTAYDLKKTIEKSTAFFYNASMGSIHPALKKLESLGHVRATGTLENGRAKKIYAITGAGRRAFADWQGEGMPLQKFRDETLVRLFFFGNLTVEEQARHLETHIAELDEKIDMLAALQEQVETMEVPPEMQNHAMFQKATLDHGLQYCRFARGWYQGLLNDKVRG